MTKKREIIIATRKSPLALWQAEYVKQQLLRLYDDWEFHISARTTTGDRTPDRALAEMGGKDLFVKDLQKMLKNKEADIAVHSLKDMSAQDSSEFTLAAFCTREDPRDVFLSHRTKKFVDLPKNSVVGTCSPRRQCQLKALRPDIEMKILRGNVGTRLAKLDNGEYDAIILAAAGLKRLGLENRINDYFEVTEVIPAIGQGIIAVECHAEDENLKALLKPLDDLTARVCATAERAVNKKIGGDCYTPIAAHATLDRKMLHLNALVGTSDGHKILRASMTGRSDHAEQLGLDVGEKLLSGGARAVLSKT